MALAQAGYTLLPVVKEDKSSLETFCKTRLKLTSTEIKMKPSSFIKRYCRRYTKKPKELGEDWDVFVADLMRLNETLVAKGEPALLKPNATDTFASIKALIEDGYLTGGGWLPMKYACDRRHSRRLLRDQRCVLHRSSAYHT